MQYASDTTGFKKRSKGGSAFFAPRFVEDTWILGFGYSLSQDEIYDVLDIYQDQIPETTLRRSALNTRVTYDTRDFKWDPKRGTENTFSAEFVGGPVGGNVHFFKPTFTHSLHIPTLTLGKHTLVLSNALRWGLVREYRSSNPVPISDRFYVGGAETVRGYAYTGEIGPIQGGKVFGVANIEYKIPLLMEGRFTIIQFALFADAGGAWRGTKDVNLNFGRSLNNLKAGIGFGIRFKTPAFPIRLDWGWGLHHRPGEAINQFNFTIGSFPYSLVPLFLFPPFLWGVSVSKAQIAPKRGAVIATIDLERIFQAYPGTKKAREEMEKLILIKENEIAAKRAEIFSLVEEIALLKSQAVQPQTAATDQSGPPASLFAQNQTGASTDTLTGAATSQALPGLNAAPAPAPTAVLPAVSNPQIEQKEALLKTKKEELKRLERDAEKNLESLEEAKTKTLLAKIYVAVKELAEEKNVDMVVDKNAILWGASRLDITEELMRRLKTAMIERE
ncbi:MAG: BamA/TamA family outer membrane protein [Elusimicrobia bacterium]|nr:BamA/TamA family outer membrane protein [Elusimicrobiota bacterium]